MECHEGATMIKSFRGLMADGAQDTINLHTNDGKTGYRIVKLEVMDKTPGTDTLESVVKVYKVEQSSVTGEIDFSDNTLLGAAYFGQTVSQYSNLEKVTIFDKEIFNQDIYITHKDNSTNGEAINYYIELEQVSLDLNESTVATLQSIRNA